MLGERLAPSPANLCQGLGEVAFAACGKTAVVTAVKLTTRGRTRWLHHIREAAATLVANDSPGGASTGVRCMSFVWKWSWEIALALVVLSVGIATYSFAQNRQLAYAPCLAKVMTALRADPAAARLQTIAAVAVPEAKDCAVSEDVAREANQAITDMLAGDKSLFSRLPQLLRDAGMVCESNKSAVVCDCKSSGPFAIANPSETCTALIDVPLPLKRALDVAVTRQPAVKTATYRKPVTYIVRVAYSTTFFEREEPALPPESEGESDGMPTVNEAISTAVQW